MIFTLTPIEGAYVIDIEPIKDDRGYFARAFCVEEFSKRGLQTEFVQHNTSYNIKKGTVRGLHYQLPPHEEVKLVRCISGRIFDVIVDVRRDSRTYLHWFSAELSEDNGKALYVPRGFAHGFQSLTDNSALYYMASTYYQKDYETGLCWNDEKLNITWPIFDNIIISEKDKCMGTGG